MSMASLAARPPGLGGLAARPPLSNGEGGHAVRRGKSVFFPSSRFIRTIGHKEKLKNMYQTLYYTI